MMHKITTLLSALMLTVYAQGQTIQKLTLQQALDLGTANSKQLILSENKIKEAQAKVAQARDQVWPEVSLSATYLRINTPKVDFTGDTGNGGNGSGTSPLAALANLHSLGLAQLSLSEPIFAGFKIRNNRMMTEYLEQAAHYDAQTAKSKVKLNTAKAFYQYYELLTTRGMVEENLKQEQQRVKEFKNKEAQKLLARNDRLKAELQLNNVELTLTELNNNVKLAEYNLSILLGLSAGTKLEIDTAAMFNATTLSTWDDYLQKGLENRGELKSAQYQVQAGESGYKVARAGKLPTLTLSAGYINAYIPNIVTITNALNAGLSFKYNFTGAIHSGHVMHEAKARYQEAEISKQILTDQVSMEIKQRYLKYEESAQKLSIAQRAIEQARENYEITQNKFNVGLVILSDYLDADVMLLQAKINYATAKAERMIAYYELQESTGNLY